ncbi:hypothetical protein CEP51_011671 [Fusarium floridanum]|uniref:Major facilitator superfamily (MFS) profile domain-containing protein n=1 Tax=Fusarium floridanum TaxID=1325733 RepID=A0A428R948_9HYPO|nr:hypothetical protein CEP51_011671 [Fusarium floridanum]
MASLTGSLCFYILLTAFTAKSTDNKYPSCDVIVSIYLFGICFASGMTPCQTLYPAECLENRTRAKGGPIKFLFVNIAMIIVWVGVELIIVYFFFPETGGKTLEELVDIFGSKNPRKASTKQTKVYIDGAGNVFELDGKRTAWRSQ